MESAVKGADVVQLERKGDAYIMSVAQYGEPFTRQPSRRCRLGDEVYVGLSSARTTRT